MRDLRIKILLFTSTATVFLILHLIGYVYNINVFREQLKVLEKSHDFMEDVLELRRYEKNFVFKIDTHDLNEVLSYIFRIKKDVATISSRPLLQNYNPQLLQFQRDLTTYERLINQAKKNKKVPLDEIRVYGHRILSFAEQVLQINKEYVNKTLDRILFIPSVVMFLFGGTLIIFLLFLTHTILRQISFIQETTHRIAQGDFSYISSEEASSSSFEIIIRAFNRMIKELESRQNDLLQAKKLASVGTLVSGIAHELNNPLNNISLTAESMLEELEGLSPGEMKDMLEDILAEARRASGVVKNLLDFSRRRSSEINELIDIKEVIEATLKLVKNQLMISDVQLIKNIPADLPRIKGNADNLKQVFINLFLNAIQAMPQGGYLKISASEDERGYVVIKVEDSGVGIPPEVMERIFDPFFSTKPVGKGTGLGLSIVYGIVKKHGGYIEVKSKQGEGTLFTIFLPVAK